MSDTFRRNEIDYFDEKNDFSFIDEQPCWFAEPCFAHEKYYSSSFVNGNIIAVASNEM